MSLEETPTDVPVTPSPSETAPVESTPVESVAPTSPTDVPRETTVALKPEEAKSMLLESLEQKANEIHAQFEQVQSLIAFVQTTL